jgi:hypothetical protein
MAERSAAPEATEPVPGLTFTQTMQLLRLLAAEVVIAGEPDPPPAQEPTRVLSHQEHVEEYARRRAAGQALFHPGDAVVNDQAKDGRPATLLGERGCGDPRPSPPPARRVARAAAPHDGRC